MPACDHPLPWVVDSHMLVEKRKEEVLGPEADNTCKFWVSFIAFTDHKITYCKVIALVLNDIETMGNRSTCNFSRKKIFLTFFSSCPSNLSHCSFVICLAFALLCLQISSSILQYFSIICSILWNSAGEMF